MKTTDYLYLWHDPKSRSVVASGLSFADIAPSLEGVSGLVLLKHCWDKSKVDSSSGLSYVEASDLPRLAMADIYPWGDFYWGDYSGSQLPRLGRREVQELEHFATQAMPLRNVRVGELGNNLLVAAHDDGWYVRIFYAEWVTIAKIIIRKAPYFSDKSHEALKSGAAFWIQGGNCIEEEATFNVDLVINRNLERSR